MECEKWMNNYLFLEEIEEFFGNFIRFICFFFFDRWLEFYLGLNFIERFIRD